MTHNDTPEDRAMMTDHTPGPHEAQGTQISGPDGMIGEVGFGMRADDEMLANAKLYAAAPDLLAALQDTLRRIEDSDEWWMDSPDRGGMDDDMIRAAIAKATSQGR